MKDLTIGAKIVLALLFIGIICGGLWYLEKNPSAAEALAPGLTAKTATATAAEAKANAPKRVAAENVVVAAMNTWGGQASGAYMNNGQNNSSTDSRFYKEFHQLVQIEKMDDFDASRAALKSGAIDVLCFATVGEFSIEAGALQADGIKVISHYDKSFGGDALVVREGINSINDLVGKTIALAPGSPSHGLFLNLIRVSGFNQSQFKIQEAKDGLDAADYFRKEQVDAAFVWSPDDVKLPNDVKGAKALFTTKTAPDIIWDCMLVRDAELQTPEKRAAIKNFVAGWLYGSSLINTNSAARAEAVQDMVQIFGLPTEDWSNLSIAKFMTLGDNLNFFGLNPSYKGVTGEELYSRMGDEYKKLNLNSGEPVISGNIPPWREVSDPSIIQELEHNPKLETAKQNAEVPREFVTPTKEIANAPAVTTNNITVEYPTGSAELTFEAKRTIKHEFGSLARGFSNAYIRIEGNTDNVGSYSFNKDLSFKRANNMKAYLISEYGWSPKRFIIKGNGPDNPVPGCEDNVTDEQRARNRRTEFELVSVNQ